jgi:2-oxoglutarate dehydrogenase E2 component (dihydrolipoamide succinyltransferase)
MALEIKIPSPGESINEVELTSWFVEDGALVNKNQELGEIESEKATLPLIAEESGQLKILVKEGETVQVGAVVANIDTSVAVPDAPAEIAPEAPATPAATSVPKVSETTAELDAVKATPVAKQIMDKEGFSVDDIIKGLKKITAGDVKKVMAHRTSSGLPQAPAEASRNEDRKKMSQLRKKISERLVAVKNETAMLTTFNEVDMSAIMAIRKQYQDQFVEKSGP